MGGPHDGGTADLPDHRIVDGDYTTVESADGSSTRYLIERKPRRAPRLRYTGEAPE